MGSRPADPVDRSLAGGGTPEYVDGAYGAPEFTGAGSGATGQSGRHDALADAKAQAAGLAERAKAQGKAMASQKKDAAADQVGSAAQALHKTADDLQGSQHPQAGRYVGFAAEQLEGLGRRLRDTDLDGLIADAQALSRRSPVVFFAGSIAAGFLVSRFMKSSAEHRHDERADDD